MISRDALLAELARVLAATRPDEADVLLARVERSFGGGNESIPLFDGLARDVRAAFGSDAAVAKPDPVCFRWEREKSSCGAPAHTR